VNVDYILYLAVAVVIFAFIAIVYMVTTGMKKKLVNKKIDRFSIRSGKRVTQKELDRILKYIEKNKKYLSPSAYKMGLYKINKAKTRMQVSQIG
jgi:hypothetical protein